MADVYGEIDSLLQLQERLKEGDIHFLSSISDISHFKQHYDAKIMEITRAKETELTLEIKEEKEYLSTMKQEYADTLKQKEKSLIEEMNVLSGIIDEITKDSKNSKSIFSRINNYFKLNFLKKRKKRLLNLEIIKEAPLKSLGHNISNKRKTLHYLENNYGLICSERVAKEAFMIKRAKMILDEQKNLWIGAIGEQRAETELKKLPDSYTIINNFKLNFHKPIYHKSTNERIYSIQLDHIVVGPSGVFIIETKNWSKNSIKNLDLYSPIEQIKRSNFALFCYLNNAIKDGLIPLLNDNWGARKVSIRNIVLMVGEKPRKEFQYVKIVNLAEVRSYIRYFKPEFSQEETQALFDYLN